MVDPGVVERFLLEVFGCGDGHDLWREPVRRCECDRSQHGRTEDAVDVGHRLPVIENVDDAMTAFHGIISHESQLRGITKLDSFHHFPLAEAVTLVKLRENILRLMFIANDSDKHFGSSQVG